MAQKKGTGSTRSASKLDSLRNQIDRLDLQLLKLANDRAKLAVDIGKIKAEQGVEVFSPAREDEILTRMVEKNTGPLDNRAVRALFRELMSASRSLQRGLRVAYLGPEYSFSHLAALEKFGSSVDYVPVATIAGVFEIVNRGQADLGLVPVENSTDGRVADTLDMFTRLPLKICAEVSLKVHHNLLAMCSLADIRRIYSKPQALSQCRKWLATNVPQAQLKEVASTTTAAQLAKQEPHAAAVASRQAGVKYGLNTLCEDIEDFENNVTRFAVVGHQASPRTGKDKTSIMFKIPDQPGTLSDVLAIFKKNKINMSWIESFPARTDGKKNEYVFFADLTGHTNEIKIKRTIEAIGRKCENLEVLGSFPRGECFD
ncbi:Prephenate dehydratase [Planctomycetes bacterium Pan216]|uniref:Bifunctional chorismate mutase/prephenate dehydratase n=1 Tax=Kolteria novifilia TaxID=2527975 RepID=A0A518B0Z0_9BACT|nr:Prephenate dehydratase [Planctomycetes bacterium Pan216]